jgi:hypothetical protein
VRNVIKFLNCDEIFTFFFMVFKFSPVKFHQRRVEAEGTKGIISFFLKILLFHVTTASRPALGPTQLPIQWVPGALSLGVKRPGRETDHSPPSIAEVKE